MLTIADWIMIFAYLGGLAVYGTLFRKFVKTTDDYFLAGRTLPWWLAGITLAAIALDASDSLAPVGLSYHYGLAGLNLFMGCLFGTFFLSAWIIPAMMQKRIITNTTWLELRYNTAARQLGVWTQVLQRSVVMGNALTAIAYIFRSAFAIEFWHGVAVAAIISLFMTAVGGHFAVVASEVFAFFLGLVVMWIWFYFGVQALGGWDAFISKCGADIHFVTFRGEFVKGIPNWIPFFGFLLLYMAYAIINQEYVKKVLSARTTWDARVGGMFPNVILWVLWILPMSLIGIIGRQLYPPGTFTGPADQVAPFILRDFVPVGFVGLIVAGFIAGSQDYGGTAQSVASLLTIDVYQRHIRRGMSEEHYVKVGRILTFIVSIIPAIWIPTIISFPFIAGWYTLITGMLITPVMIPYILGPLTTYLSRWSAFGGCLIASAVGLYIKLGPVAAWMKNSWIMIYFIVPAVILGMLLISVIENSVKKPIPKEELQGVVLPRALGMSKSALTTKLQEILSARAYSKLAVKGVLAR